MTAMSFELLAFFPADHAEAVNGKLYVHGGYWERLNFPMYPQVFPSFALVAVVRVPFAAYQAEHRFRFGMEDADGNELSLRVEGAFRVGAAPDMEYGDPTVMPIAVPVHNLVIERPGQFAFTFALDDAPLGRFAVKAMQVAAPLQFNLTPPVDPSEGGAS